MRRILTTAIFILALTGAATAFMYAKNNAYNFAVPMRREEASWVRVEPNDPRLTTAAQLGLRGVSAQAGAVDWQSRSDGFESGEMPILVDGQSVDRILLARIDPKLWRLSVHHAPTGDHDLPRWMKDINATLVVNGSFSSVDGAPETPLVNEGVLLGPKDYRGPEGDHSAHGALVVKGEGVAIVDMKDMDWRKALSGAQTAMVSYPMLIGADGQSRAKPSRWLANRSFIGQDSQGRIIIGTTADALLSLDKFADILKAAPLDLQTALNLDSGPVACQGIAIGDFSRQLCGSMEVEVKGADISMLETSQSNGAWALPIILAVTPISAK